MKPLGVSAAMATAALHAATALAQPTIEDIRDRLRESLSDPQFAKSFSTQIIMSNEIELTGAFFEVDDQEDTTLRIASLPFRRSFGVLGEDRPGLYVEGAVGYALASESVPDLYQGDLPGFETSVDAEWIAASGLLGIGAEFEPIEGLTLAPIVNAGVAYIESRADYAGPGEALSEAIADGIAFNWDAWVASVGLAGRAEWRQPLEHELELTLLGRYDIRWAETVESDDDAQEFSSTSQFGTIRTDLTGPTGIELGGSRIRWRTTASFRFFTQGNLYGISEYVQVGGGIEINDSLPIVRRLSISAGVILGADVTGYNLGIGVSF